MKIRTDKKELLYHYKDSSNLVRRVSLHQNYSTSSVDWSTWLFERINFPAAARILEVGCGPGGLWKSTDKADKLNWSPYLTDLSAGMVSEARAALADNERFQFVTADSQDLPFPNGHFDGLLSCHMMYHVPNRPRAIAEFRRVLRPGSPSATTERAAGYFISTRVYRRVDWSNGTGSPLTKKDEKP